MCTDTGAARHQIRPHIYAGAIVRRCWSGISERYPSSPGEPGCRGGLPTGGRLLPGRVGRGCGLGGFYTVSLYCRGTCATTYSATPTSPLARTHPFQMSYGHSPSHTERCALSGICRRTTLGFLTGLRRQGRWAYGWDAWAGCVNRGSVASEDAALLIQAVECHTATAHHAAQRVFGH